MASQSFEIVDVSDWPVDLIEPSGSGDPVWLVDPLKVRHLFKPSSLQGRRHGSDWAEKISSELALTMGVPAAAVSLAQRSEVRGCLSRDLRPEGWEMHAGAVLVAREAPHFVRLSPDRSGHSLEVIHRVLSGLPPPSSEQGWSEDMGDSFDAFCGLLVLDAVIANADRHEDNWSVLRDPNGSVTLAPSYDHGSALGFNLTDDARVRQLSDGLRAWANKGFATRFEGCRRVTLVSFALEALDVASPKARAHWLNVVEVLDLEICADAVGAVDGLSAATRRFVVELVKVNRGRLLDGAQRGGSRAAES